MSPAAFNAGRVLRVNGRWSITHLWKTGIDELETKCGLIYDASEIYDGEEAVEVFDDSTTPDWLNCSGCFPEGTATVKTASDKEQNG